MLVCGMLEKGKLYRFTSPKFSVWSTGDIINRYRTILFETEEVILFLGSRKPKAPEYEVIKRSLGALSLTTAEEFKVITALHADRVINFVLHVNASCLESFKI